MQNYFFYYNFKLLRNTEWGQGGVGGSKYPKLRVRKPNPHKTEFYLKTCGQIDTNSDLMLIQLS